MSSGSSRPFVAGLEAALGSAVQQVQPVGGGCVSPAFRVGLDGGRVLFLKEAPASAPDDLLRQEALGLQRLRSAAAVRVPEVVAVNAEWLALEWLEPAPATDAAWASLGRGIARLHRVRGSTCGWDSDNYIGPLPQANGSKTSWGSFWAERRLQPQLRLARRALRSATLDRFQALLESLDDRLAPADSDGPSLLHGDLWHGNVHMTVAGPALIDPSCSYGHREVDLAMAALFGGFPPSFLAAYAAEWPLLPDAERRRPIYQLYYLLVHVNLFGGGYIGATERALDAALRG